jgi:hypothetical protein
MAARPPPPSECAQCGASIPPGARACLECGADERTGWRENSIYDGLDLPDDEDAPFRESAPSRRVNGLAWYWWCIAVAVLLLIGLSFLGVL